MSGKPETHVLSAPIEDSVRKNGVTPQAVWMDRDGALEKGVRRAGAIFRAIPKDEPFTLLDVGCGPGFAIPWLEERFGKAFSGYLGVDISESLLAAAKARFPDYRFAQRDIIADPLPERSFDHVVINGVVTAKFGLGHEEMEKFATALVASAWRAADKSLSFNAMSPHVDWTRDDLFHWPMDHAAAFCIGKLSRHVNIIADYGLYEYTVQVFRAQHQAGAVPAGWT